MITTMNLSGYEIELDEQDDYEIEPDGQVDRYGEEIMSAGWNPAVDLVSEQLQEVQADAHLARAAEYSLLNTRDDISEAVSEIFLRKMYSYQH